MPSVAKLQLHIDTRLCLTSVDVAIQVNMLYELIGIVRLAPSSLIPVRVIWYLVG